VNRLTKQAERCEQERLWRQAGEQAFYAGTEYVDWPRPAKKYGIEWYSTKNAWQRGWMIASGLQPLTKPVQAVFHYLNKPETEAEDE
jgi:hypothetical protein